MDSWDGAEGEESRANNMKGKTERVKQVNQEAHGLR